MHVIGPQHIGVDGAAVLACDLAQILQVAQAIGVVEEAGLAVVAALDDVLGHTGQIDPGTSGHARILAMACERRCPCDGSDAIGASLAVMW